MAESYDQIARRLPPGSERTTYKYLANRSDSFGSQGALIQDRTRLFTLAVQELVTYGLSGKRESDTAFEAAAGKLPSQRYNVFLRQSELDQIGRQLDEIPRQLAATLREIEAALRAWDASQTNYSKADHEAHRRQITEQARRYQTLRDRLKLHHAVPADPNDASKWLREGY